MALRVRQAQIDRLVAQARAEAPNECCGVLAGNGEIVEEVFPGRNMRMSPTVYEMDPQDQLRAFRAMDSRGWDLVGIYHSHPRTEAYPSRTDVDRALYPDARYVIVSLRDATHPQVRAFRIVDGQIAEEEVVIT